MSQALSFELSGLSCAGCVRRAETALREVDGVDAAAVNLATETAEVRGQARPVALAAALSEAGYPARTRSGRFRIEGMTCASCVGRVEAALSEAPGVIEARVNIASETADVTWFSGTTNPARLAEVITGTGYPAAPLDEDEAPDSLTDRKDREAVILRRDLIVAALLTLPIFIVEMGGHLVPSLHHAIGQSIGHDVSWTVQFVLASVVLAGPGRRFFRLGVPGLLRGAPDMNALVALGAGAAWAYSTLALFAPGLFPDGTRVVYFEAAAVITTLILLGRWLEARAKGRTGAAIRRLVSLAPPTAQVERGGDVVELAVEAMSPGDVFRVAPGGRVAVDGVVLEGTSYVDESMLSGEPLPVAKAADDMVTGGTVNGTGALRVQATAVGADTVLAGIVRMVEAAQGAKLPIQALVDRVTAVFVPVVMAVAALTVTAWLLLGPAPALPLALVAGVSVLIIACPCAMGLATPTSIMVGTGRAAELGVLFRRGDALQALQKAGIVAFDKTGTLTEGRPSVVTLEADDADLARIAAVEALSEHPVARAVVSAAKARGLTLPTATGFESVPGQGVRACVEGSAVLVGTVGFLADQGVELGRFAEAAATVAARGETQVVGAVDGRAVAVIGVSDPVKDSAAEAVAGLRSRGFEVAMITGDTEMTAQAIAAQLGIDHVTAEVRPDGKVMALRALRETYGPVAFVGDGLNDAPVLAEADTGIALGTGTDIAIEAADVVLMSGDPRGVLRAVDVSRATLRNIRQNLFWAFAYNVALIPVAAGLLYPLTGTMLSPMLAAGAMALSSVFVVSNALRLRRAA